MRIKLADFRLKMELIDIVKTNNLKRYFDLINFLKNYENIELLNLAKRKNVAIFLKAYINSRNYSKRNKNGSSTRS